MRDVAIIFALMGGEDPAWVMRMAKESATPEWHSGGTPTLDPDERKSLELLAASELQSTADEEEAVAVGE